MTLIVKRIWIEQTQCTASTLCEPEAPGLIEAGEETVEIREALLQRTQRELELLFGAAGVCPVAAFYLETQEGRVFNVEDDFVQQAVSTGDYRWAREGCTVVQSTAVRID